MIFGGIDAAKHRHELCLTDDAGGVIRQMFIDNNQKGFQKLLQAMDHLGMEPGGVEFCMEATGRYWLALYCHLIESGYSVHGVNPIQSDAMRNLYVRKTKTDQNDALLLADLMRFGRVPDTKLASETTLRLQNLSRIRMDFVHQIGGLKNRVIGILDRIFPEYSQCFSKVFIRTSMELLKEHPEPEEIAELDISELADFLKKHSRGRIGVERAEQIQELARGTFGIRLALDAFTLQLRLLVEQIEFIEEQVSVLEGAID